MARAINTTAINTKVRTEAAERFLADARKYPVIVSAEEELELIFKAQKGDKSAQDTLVNSNLRFIFSLASKFAKGDEVMDLVSAATIGMISAIASFDATIGTRLLSYAVHYMRMEISRYFATDAQLVRNKSHITTRVNALNGKFFAENGRQATEDELVEMLKAEYDIEVKSRIAVVGHTYSSLSAKLDEDGATAEEVGEIAVTTASHNEYEDEMDAEDNTYKVNRLLSTLPEKPRAILEMSFGIGYDMPLDDAAIAEKMGLTAERVRQIKLKALASLRERGARVLAM